MDILGSLILATMAVATPASVELERLADNSYRPTGIPGEFYIEVLAPVPCGERVLFEGITLDDIRTGLYSASSAGVEVIANPTTPVPGSSSTFQTIARERCVGNGVAFLGLDVPSPSPVGASVYFFANGEVTVLLPQGLALGGTTVQAFDHLAGNETGVAMIARLGLPTLMKTLMVKPFSGSLAIVADETTVLPGQTEPMKYFDRPVMDGPDVLFYAETGLTTLGVYRWSQGQGISLVADTHTPVPALGGESLWGLRSIIANLDDGVVFEGFYTGGLGIFIAPRDGEIRPLVLPGQVTVDGEVLLSAFFPTGAGSLLAFRGRTADNPLNDAIFARTADGNVRRLLGEGDTIDGRGVHRIVAGADHASVAIRVESLDLPRSQVIYRARFAAATDIPALSWPGIAVLAIAIALTGWLALRRC